jgi:hypothetical protein
MVKGNARQTDSSDALNDLRKELEDKADKKLYAVILVVLAVCGFGVQQILALHADIDAQISTLNAVMSKQDIDLGQRITVLETKMGMRR